MKRLKDIQPESRNYKKEADKVVKMVWKDDEISEERILQAARFVIAAHKVELEKLADK